MGWKDFSSLLSFLFESAFSRGSLFERSVHEFSDVHEKCHES